MRGSFESKGSLKLSKSELRGDSWPNITDIDYLRRGILGSLLSVKFIIIDLKI